MAMPPSGTFSHVAILPDGVATGGFECAAPSADIATLGRFDDGTRLVGPSPRLIVYDAGFNERPGPDRPHVLRHGLRLEASGRRRASVRTATLHLEATLLPSLRPGDRLHLVCTASADLGVSVIRDGVLVCAIGEVVAVPLGAGVEARVPHELRARIAALFLELDPDFPDVQGLGNAVPLPLAVRHDGTEVLVNRVRRTLGPYDIEVLRPSSDGLPGHAAVGTIVHRGACSALGARLTAMLLAQDDGLEMTPW